MKRYLSLALAAALLLSVFGTSAMGASPDDLKVTFNGHNVSFDVAPRIENGRTLVPFRAIFEKMGATINYDAASRTIRATRGSKNIALTIGSTTATVDGKSVALDVAPSIVDDRTLVPLRFVGEALGASVTYDGASRVVKIVDPNYPKRGGTVTMSQFSAPKVSFSPWNIPNDVYTGFVISQLYSSLWYYDDKVQPTPDLATHWDISADEKTITYHLRKDAKFHDGTPVTAHDVAFTYYVLLHPDYKGTVGGGAKMIAGYEAYNKSGNRADLTGLKVIDDYTIAFTSSQVDAGFFVATGGTASPRHKYENVPVADIGTSKDPNNVFPIGSGPFKWKEHVEGQYIVWEKNPDYYGGEVYLDKVIWRVQPAATAVAQMEIGAIDWMEQVAPADIAKLSGMNHVKVVEYAGGSYQVMNINNRNYPLSDKRLRQALAYAFDRPAIIQNILLGHASPMLTPIHPLNWAYNADVDARAYNPAKAKELIASMGYTMRNDGYFYDSNGKRLKLRLHYPTGNAARVATAPVAQQFLKDIGIEVELIVMDFASMLAVVRDDPKADWDLSFSGWSIGNPEPDPRQLYAKNSIGPGLSNMAGWSTPKSEELIAKSMGTLDLEARIEAFSAWQEHFVDEQPNLPLYAVNKIDAVNTRIQGYKPHPYSYGQIWNIFEWSVTK